jgi:hypothetical protein
MKRLMIAGLILVLGVAIAFGCGSSGAAPSVTTQATPAGWNALAGQTISLALPASFHGGRPTDSDVVAWIEQASKLNPNVAKFLSLIKGADIQLIAFGEAGADGTMPIVMAMREAMPSSQSLKKTIEATTAQLSKLANVKYNFENISEERAEFTAYLPAWQGSTMMLKERSVMLRSGSYLYTVLYAVMESYGVDMDPIFRTSVGTVTLKKQ